MSEKYTGPARSSPYGLSRLAPSISLVEAAKEIQYADMMIGVVTASKLQVIAEQIRHLQEQARAVLEGAKIDLDLHRAYCGFIRRPGKTYHLYEKAEGSLYWSMLSPEEWGYMPPDEFKGSFRLEPDQSWSKIDADISQEKTGEHDR